MNVKLLTQDPYAEVICRYFASTFHKTIKADAKQLLEILTVILVGDKNVRQGPIPKPEQLVVIRKTISDSVDKQLPIPILIAWGGVKGGMLDKSIDVAEVAALHQLLRMVDSVHNYYSPGVQITIRIEDTGANWLYREQGLPMFDAIERYSADFTRLVLMTAPTVLSL